MDGDFSLKREGMQVRKRECINVDAAFDMLIINYTRELLVQLRVGTLSFVLMNNYSWTFTRCLN